MTDKMRLKILEKAAKKICEALDQTEKLCYQEPCSRPVHKRLRDAMYTLELIQGAIKQRMAKA